MIVIGADTHKASHTAAAVLRRRARCRGSDGAREAPLVRGPGAVGAASGRRASVGARGLPSRLRALERFLLARGERVVRVPPRLTAEGARGARERGKSDPIDAVAIARAAIREGIETLPTASSPAPSSRSGCSSITASGWSRRAPG